MALERGKWGKQGRAMRWHCRGATGVSNRWRAGVGGRVKRGEGKGEEAVPGRGVATR